MKYERVHKASFMSRPNRFIAYVKGLCEDPEQTETVHVKNTGRCAELLIPGAEVYVQKTDNPSRKTKWDLIAVKKDGQIINMDSQVPNKAVKEWLKEILFLASQRYAQNTRMEVPVSISMSRQKNARF